jgi:disulfide bond formation protein DsbB
MLGVAFGAMLNLRYGIRPSHYGVSLISAVFGACVSTRQILLHIVPGTGTSGYGSAVLGLHLYTWAFIVFAVVILLIGIVMFFEGQFEKNADNKSNE